MNRRELFVQLKEAAIKYRKSSDELAIITDNDLTMPGCMAQIMSGVCAAEGRINPNGNIFTLPEGYAAGRDCYEMGKIMDKLQDDYGESRIDLSGFTGDIISGDYPGYKPYGKIRGNAF